RVRVHRDHDAHAAAWTASVRAEPLRSLRRDGCARYNPQRHSVRALWYGHAVGRRTAASRHRDLILPYGVDRAPPDAHHRRPRFESRRCDHEHTRWRTRRCAGRLVENVVAADCAAGPPAIVGRRVYMDFHTVCDSLGIASLASRDDAVGPMGPGSASLGPVLWNDR